MRPRWAQRVEALETELRQARLRAAPQERSLVLRAELGTSVWAMLRTAAVAWWLGSRHGNGNSDDGDGRR